MTFDLGQRKAYRITIKSWPSNEFIIPATTASRARYLVFLNADDAGYNIPIIDFRSRRAPEFDDLARETEGKIPWTLGWTDGRESFGCLSNDNGN